MATDQIDNVIGYLMELKKLRSQLELKDEEIRKYVDLLLTRRSNDYDQSFMIYSYETDEDAINIIGQHLMEFSEMIYDQHYLLIARKEINRNIGIYLMPFEEDCNLGTTLDAIEILIDSKREECENESYSVPSKRIVPEMKILNNTMAEIDKRLDEFKVQSNVKFHEMKTDFKATLENLRYFQKQSIKREEKLYLLAVSKFYAQRNLEYIRNSATTLEKMCMRLSVKNDSRAEAPFKDILSMEDKKKELIGYFDFLQKNLDGSTEGTEIQRNIREWMRYNWSKLVYKPTTLEQEELKKDMEQKLGVKNTIGTVCFFPLTGGCFCYCIANSKIIDWNCGSNKEETLRKVHKYLKNPQKWNPNAKFATDMDVSDDLSDYFVHVSSDEIMKISNNQKVMEWITNNFESSKYSFIECYYQSFPAIYTLALKCFEESLE